KGLVTKPPKSIKKRIMIKISLNLFFVILFFFGFSMYREGSEKASDKDLNAKLQISQDNPSELKITQFSGPDLTPSPACLAVAPTGEVFVGVDMIGSLGKDPGKGSILRLV